MTSGFSAELVTGDRFVVIALSGELDLAEATSLRETFDRAVRTQVPLVVVDASGLTFIDSVGIGVLVAAHNNIVRTGGVFAVANLATSVGRPIRLTEVDTAVPIHWAGEQPVFPWATPDAQATDVLVALGFAAAAASLSAGIDETIG